MHLSQTTLRLNLSTNGCVLSSKHDKISRCQNIIAMPTRVRRRYLWSKSWPQLTTSKRILPFWKGEASAASTCISKNSSRRRGSSSLMSLALGNRKRARERSASDFFPWCIRRRGEGGKKKQPAPRRMPGKIWMPRGSRQEEDPGTWTVQVLWPERTHLSTYMSESESQTKTRQPRPKPVSWYEVLAHLRYGNKNILCLAVLEWGGPREILAPLSRQCKVDTACC